MLKPFCVKNAFNCANISALLLDVAKNVHLSFLFKFHPTEKTKCPQALFFLNDNFVENNIDKILITYVSIYTQYIYGLIHILRTNIYLQLSVPGTYIPIHQLTVCEF